MFRMQISRARIPFFFNEYTQHRGLRETPCSSRSMAARALDQYERKTDFSSSKRIGSSTYLTESLKVGGLTSPRACFKYDSANNDSEMNISSRSRQLTPRVQGPRHRPDQILSESGRLLNLTPAFAAMDRRPAISPRTSGHISSFHGNMSFHRTFKTSLTSEQFQTCYSFGPHPWSAVKPDVDNDRPTPWDRRDDQLTSTVEQRILSHNPLPHKPYVPSHAMQPAPADPLHDTFLSSRKMMRIEQHEREQCKQRLETEQPEGQRYNPERRARWIVKGDGGSWCVA
jgi:hypothetical protein